MTTDCHKKIITIGHLTCLHGKQRTFSGYDSHIATIQTIWKGMPPFNIVISSQTGSTDNF